MHVSCPYERAPEDQFSSFSFPPISRLSPSGPGKTLVWGCVQNRWLFASPLPQFSKLDSFETWKLTFLQTFVNILPPSLLRRGPLQLRPGKLYWYIEPLNRTGISFSNCSLTSQSKPPGVKVMNLGLDDVVCV